MASFQLDPGSYFIQMPTQEGRHALVIFPPGPQSLQDIRHMYELQDEENLPQIQSLKRTIVAGDGECRCLLKMVWIIAPTKEIISRIISTFMTTS